ncbi:S-layer homology domain-containing protein [uncultured Fenollaria sp.]|uniref:S-layer homology domain-containing protein n=1 Tax=uncultured Fenollaria sp. TaxID=1686315 RepID=UPI0025F9C879|nr:S-layer homology domain-containing protein [uncultured Fenollaria sp.]
MKNKFISLLLAFLMLVTALPVPAIAQEVGPDSEELVELDYEFERIDGQDYIKVTLPANSVEIVEDPYAMRPMSITDSVPTEGGAGHLINWGAGVLWYDYNNAYPPDGKEYVAKLSKNVNGKNIVIAKTENIATAATTTEDMDPDKDTTYQFITTDDYEKGDEKLTGLVVTFPVKLDQNIIYFVNQKPKSGKLNNSTNTFNLVFLAVSRLTSPTYTAEWDKTTEALQPTIKGKLITGKNQAETFEVFKENGKYGTICNKPPKAYVDEKDKDGKLIEDIVYDRKGSLDIKSVLWSLGSQPVMNGKFLSYTVFENGKNIEKPLNNKKGTIPSYTEKKFDYGIGQMTETKYPPYFYNLVGDNDHMWRFQLKEGLEVKFNTGVGSATQGGEKGQDIGQASTIAYGEKFDSNLKGAFSENTFTLPTATPVAPKLNKNNVNLTFKGWKLVEGKEEPRNPQEIKTDSEGKQTLTEVKPDYATTDALKTALTAAGFKGFSEKNPVFYAIFGQTQGKAKIEYVDDKGANLLNADQSVKIDGQDYKTEKLGDLNEDVTATTDEAPQFKGYAINKVELDPATGAKYVDPATATIKFVYKVKATTDDKSSDQDYIKVTFDANGGNFGTEAEKTKYVYVLKDKASFADAKEKVSDPSKDNAIFNEWQTAKTGGTKVADDKTLSKANETFYANYTTKAQGKATIEYIDVKTGKSIDEKYRAEEAAKYPEEKEGNQGKKVTVEEFTKEKAPKFVGYEFNRVDVSPKDGTYALPASSVIKVYYNKLADVIKDDTPDTDDDKPTGYVTVTFKPGEHGTLDGKNENVVYYVNPKLNPAKTMAEITQPTVKANTGYKVADPKWKDDKNAALDTATQITKDLTYTAQYTAGQDVIPVPDPSNPPEKPDGYVTVKFDLDGKGTTTDTKEFYVNPKKEVEITAPTVTGIGDYKQKTGDDAWSPKFVTKAKYTEDKTFVAQYDFTKDVVPQGPGEDKPVVPNDYVKVQFKQGDHGTIDQNQTTIYWVNPEVEVDLTEKAPTVKADPEYKHTGWDKELKATFATATDITAKYLKKVLDKEPTEDADKYVKVDFKAETHGKIKDGEKKEFWVLKDETVEIKTPAVEPNANYAFEKWDPAVQTSYSENKTHNAVFKYTGDNVVPQPGNDKPDVPDNFVEVVFEQGTNGTIANTETVTYWVNPKVKVTVTAPKVTANEGWKHVAWTYKLKATDTTEKEVKTLESVTDKFTEKTTITAKYLKKVLEEEPQTDKDAYVKVTFKAETNGKLPENKTEKSVWVLKGTPVTVTEPTVIANAGWKFIKFDPAVKDSYSKDTEHKAQYKKIIVTEDPKDKDYVKVTFDPAAQGTIKTGSNAEVWVLKNETIDTKDITPELEVKEKYAFEKWDPAVQTSYSTDTKHTAIYKYNGDDVVPQKPGEDKPNVPDNFVKVEFVAGDHGIIANTETTIYWVNPAKEVTVNAPTVKADEDWKHVAWTYKVNDTDKTTSGDNALTTVKDTFTAKETTITAKYLKKVLEEEPQTDKDAYVKVTFDKGVNGTIASTETATVWVLKNTDVTVTAPKVTPKSGYTFTEWSPAVKNNYDADTTHTAQYKEKDKIIEDPTTPAAEEGYVRLTFDATKDGKINGKQTKVIDVLDTLKYSDKDLQDKIGSIKAIPTDETKKFNAWTPAVPADDTAVTEATYTASYVDKDKIIDVTPGSEDEDPDNAYVRFIFNAVGTDKESNTVNGTVKGNAKYAFDVLKGTKFNDNDLQTKINSLKAVAKDYKFIKWTPDVLNNDTLVEAGNVTKHEYTATYEKLEKIIDVTDPTVDPDEYHVRLTFKSGEGTFGKDAENKDIKEIAIDVLKETSYTDKDLQNKVKEIEGKAKANDENKKFNAWNPQVPATGLVETQDFTAQYVDKDKIIDDPTTPAAEEGYVRLTFDATKDGKINGKQTKVIDVLDTLKYSDKDLQDKIGSIKAIPTDETKKFNAWTPAVPADDTAVTEATYTASYVDKDKIIDVTPGSEDEDPDNAYVRFIFNAVGTDKESNTVNGTVKGNAKYAFDVLKGTKFNDNDLQTKINSLKAVAKDYKFIKWTPDVLNNDTLVEAGNVTKHEYTATYEKLEKIIDVTDPTVDPDEYHVRLTFDATKDGKIGDVNGQQTKAIDVLKGTPYTDRELIDKIANIKAIPVKDDNGTTVEDTNKEFNAWSPLVPTTGYVNTETFKASYKTKTPGQESIDILATKTWQDADGSAPTFTTPEVKFELWRKVGQAGAEEIVKQAIALTNNSVTFSGVDKYNANNVEYTYFVKEVFTNAAEKDNWILEGDGVVAITDKKGTVNLTNKLKGDPTNPDQPNPDTDKVATLTITKKLENEPVVQAQTNGMRRAPKQALKFPFIVTGPYGYEETFELTANESKTLENLAYGDYTVVETDSKGYTPEYSKAKETLTKDSPSGSITVTNKNKESTDPQKPNENIIDVTVKKVWSGVPQGSTTSQVKIELWRKGYDLNDKEFEQKVGEFTTAADNTGAEETKKFEKLAKQDPSGRDFTYYAVEPTVPENYTASYSDDNLTVTNTYKAPEKEYTVTYDKGADAATGTMNPVKVAENTDYTILGNGFNYADHDFTGWKIYGTNEIKQPGDVIEITKDEKLIAQWKETETPEPAPTTFTIKYISMDTEKGTVSPASETVAITGGTIAGSTATATTGNKFVKWMDTDGNTKSTDANFVPTERKDATYIAVFEADTSVTPDPEPTEFTIKYVSTDTTKGTVSPATETVAITGGTITGSTATATTGNKFVKWIDTDGNTKSTDANFVPTERKDATYIAVFEADTSVTPEPAPTEFTIKYVSTDAAKGTVSPASETVAITGGTITGSTATATTGNKFVKWIDTDGNTKSTEANFVPTERKDATYIAVFEKEEVTPEPQPEPTYFVIKYISADTNQGTVSPESETVETEGGKITGSTAFARTGYRFVKWLGTDGFTKSTDERFVPTAREAATYIAVFEKIGSVTPPEPWPPTPGPGPEPDPRPWPPYRPHRPDPRPYDRDDRDDRDDDTVRKPEDTRPVLNHEAYMFGYTDGTVRPNGNITRAEAAALITRLLGIEAYASAAKPNFPDTPSAWYNKAINAAVERGIMKGYPDGRFRPNAPITRAEFTQMISTIDNKPYGVAPFADVVGHWAERPIGSEYQAGRIAGYPDGLFRPNAYITRCEAVVILNKIFERNYDELSAINAINAERIKRFIDLAPSFWGYNDMVEATNSHSFKRRVEGRIEEDWVLVK